MIPDELGARALVAEKMSCLSPYIIASLIQRAGSRKFTAQLESLATYLSARVTR